MAERVSITWDFPNWVTVVLMVTIGLTVAAAIGSMVRRALPTMDADA